jgi:UDP-N-acetylmuramyl pentapeptide phosphotransferase/UDP-N-acetylglucosamine-1-phosphate transferase
MWPHAVACLDVASDALASDAVVGMIDVSALDMASFDSSLRAGLVPGGTWIVIFFVVSLVGTWAARRYALHRQLLDLPGERRSHSIATPRGGGIAIVVSVLLALLWLIAHDPAHAAMLGAVATGLCLVAGIGWIDDHRPLPPWPRLAVQGIAAFLLAWGIHQEGGGLSTAAIAFVAAMVLVNVWNFMDGIDGLATSQALLVAAAFGLLASSGAVAWLSLALAAACVGFLPYNLPKARIFLGDVGSGALGYALAALGSWLMLGEEGSRASALLLLLPVSAFLIDASLTLAARVFAGQRWWLPHVEHAYQHWARRVHAHGRVTLGYGAWTLLATACMLVMVNAEPGFIMFTLAVVFLLGAMAWSSLRRDR